jgi:hypothetical protein
MASSILIEAYAGYSKDELANLCRAKNVGGHSKKKVPELIDLLMKAGVVPERKIGTVIKKVQPAIVESSPVADTDTNSTSSTSSYEYIFHAEWKNVIQYIESASVQLVIAESTSHGSWIAECIRTLEPNGRLVIHGALTPEDTSYIPPHINVKSVNVGNHKLVVLCNGTVELASSTGVKSLPRFYESLLCETRSDATILLPFASEETCKLVRKCRRSFVTMDHDQDCVARLYAIVQ